MESIISLLFYALIFATLAWGIWWVATHYFPEPVRTVALIFTGILLIIVLLWALTSIIPLPPLLRGG